jgi:hypothetical protein
LNITTQAHTYLYILGTVQRQLNILIIMFVCSSHIFVDNSSRGFVHILQIVVDDKIAAIVTTDLLHAQQNYHASTRRIKICRGQISNNDLGWAKSHGVSSAKNIYENPGGVVE